MPKPRGAGRALVRGLAVGGVVAGLAVLAGCGGSDPEPSDPPAQAAGPDCGGETPPRADGGTYVCTFTEDFDGSSVDWDTWTAQETRISGMFTGGNGCYVNSPANIAVSDGALHLTARVEAAPFTCTGPLGSFPSQRTVASIATRGHFAQAYGRFEFRARMTRTTAPGVHAGLWLYPAAHTYGKWPWSGEVDVAEWFSGLPHQLIPSVHYEGEQPPASSGANCPVADPWEWHQYAVEWTETEMRFLYDGQECFRHAWTAAPPLTLPQPFDQPFNIVLTQGFGAAWNRPTAATPPVATLDVDWVRAWR